MDPPARILIVEDEHITALAVARQLRRLGYQVVAVANSGPQAIAQALALRPDVVLMDIRLQGAMTASTPRGRSRPPRRSRSST